MYTFVDDKSHFFYEQGWIEVFFFFLNIPYMNYLPIVCIQQSDKKFSFDFFLRTTLWTQMAQYTKEIVYVKRLPNLPTLRVILGDAQSLMAVYVKGKKAGLKLKQI